MLFNSLKFLIFFPAVVLLYFVLPKRVRNLWLLVASYVFYMGWNAKYVVLLFTSTLITYLSGLLLERVKDSDRPETKKTALKKWVVAVSFLLNLGILFYFKYVNFFLDTLGAAASLVGLTLNVPKFDILLPVGISFFTFQALSYTVDVYRGEIGAEKSFLRSALFVSFFPQLVAGPIERSKNLLQQLDTPKSFDFDRAREGFVLMLWGYFLKIVLADRIAIFVDTVYGDIAAFPGWYLIAATVLFAVQIYCDFGGYSTIAVGAAKILGIELMENFDAPYLSTSVSQFWRRWHISLTSWFKDYLYIPLGGSRKGKLRKYLNKMIVFLVSGLWHGADATFVIWGGLNGLYQVLGEALAPARDKACIHLGLHREKACHKIAQGIITFLLIDFSWIFFRAADFTQAASVIRSIFTAANPWVLFDGSLYGCGLDRKNFTLMLLGIGLLFLADLCKRRGLALHRVLLGQDWWARIVLIAAAILALLVFGKWGPGFNQASFIYFQF